MLHSMRCRYFAFIPMFLLYFHGNLAYASCDKEGANIIFYGGGSNPVSDSGERGDQCQDIPDTYLVTFFKIGLCSLNPAVGARIGGSPDYKSCTFIYDGIALDHEISIPATGTLATGSFSLTPGTYPYMVATFSNKLGIKNTISFTNEVQGLGGKSGSTCWTSGGLTTFHSEFVTTAHGVAMDNRTIKCGAASEAAPVFNYEVLTHFEGPNDSCVDFTAGDAAEFSNGGMTDAEFDGAGQFTVRVLKSDGSYADDCSNSARMLWVIKLASKATVTPTSQYRLDFKISDAVSIDFDNEDGSIMKMGNDPFELVFTVTP
jgi:hypothetical protein